MSGRYPCVVEGLFEQFTRPLVSFYKVVLSSLCGIFPSSICRFRADYPESGYGDRCYSTCVGLRHSSPFHSFFVRNGRAR